MADDLISRQAALDAVSANLIIDKSVAKRILMQLPTARKKGKWKLDFAHNDAQCSECGFHFKDAFDIDTWDNFCRHCGADMR